MDKGPTASGSFNPSLMFLHLPGYSHYPFSNWGSTRCNKWRSSLSVWISPRLTFFLSQSHAQAISLLFLIWCWNEDRSCWGGGNRDHHRGALSKCFCECDLILCEQKSKKKPEKSRKSSFSFFFSFFFSFSLSPKSDSSSSSSSSSCCYYYFFFFYCGFLIPFLSFVFFFFFSFILFFVECLLEISSEAVAQAVVASTSPCLPLVTGSPTRHLLFFTTPLFHLFAWRWLPFFIYYDFHFFMPIFHFSFFISFLVNCRTWWRWGVHQAEPEGVLNHLPDFQQCQCPPENGWAAGHRQGQRGASREDVWDFW